MKIFVLAAVALSFVGCKSEPPKPGEPVTFETLCTAKYDATMEKGLEVTKRVTLEGYLGAPRMLVCSSTCNLYLYPTPDRKGDGIAISLTLGDDPNQLEELPDEYTEQDFKLHTNDGKVVGIGAKIRVTGGRLGTDGKKTCQLTGVDLIESA